MNSIPIIDCEMYEILNNIAKSRQKVRLLKDSVKGTKYEKFTVESFDSLTKLLRLMIENLPPILEKLDEDEMAY